MDGVNPVQPGIAHEDQLLLRAGVPEDHVGLDIGQNNRFEAAVVVKP